MLHGDPHRLELYGTVDRGEGRICRIAPRPHPHKPCSRSKSRRIEQIPSPPEKRLEVGVKVGWFKPEGVAGDKPGGNGKRTAERDSEMCKIPAYARAFRRGI